MPIYYIRIDHTKHNLYSCYHVQAANKEDAGLVARNKFAQDVGCKYENTKVGYTWAEGITFDLKRNPVIS